MSSFEREALLAALLYPVALWIAFKCGAGGWRAVLGFAGLFGLAIALLLSLGGVLGKYRAQRTPRPASGTACSAAAGAPREGCARRLASCVQGRVSPTMAVDPFGNAPTPQGGYHARRTRDHC